MSALFKYSLPELIRAWVDYKTNTVERFSGSNDAVMGMAVGVFIIVLLISLIVWIVALILLISHAHEMPTWAVVVAILFLVLPLPGGALVTILLALLVRD